MSKGKGQQVTEHTSIPLELQLPDGKEILQTAQRCYHLKIKSFYKYYQTAVYMLSLPSFIS